MKPTGKINPITGDEIMQFEEYDIDWNINWEDMTIEQKAGFCSFMEIRFLSLEGEGNEPMVKALYFSRQSMNK